MSDPSTLERLAAGTARHGDGWDDDTWMDLFRAAVIEVMDEEVKLRTSFTREALLSEIDERLRLNKALMSAFLQPSLLDAIGPPDRSPTPGPDPYLYLCVFCREELASIFEAYSHQEIHLKEGLVATTLLERRTAVRLKRRPPTPEP